MKKLLFTLFITLLITACKKETLQSELPPATQTGENTVGCLINGETVFPEGRLGSLLSGMYSARKMPMFETRSYGDTLVTVEVSRYMSGTAEPHFINFKMALRIASGKGVYAIGGQTGNSLNINYGECQTNSKEAANFINGKLTITYANSELHIISGRFEAAFRSSSCSVPVTVQNGRFDLTY